MPSPKASLNALRALSGLFLLRVLRPALLMITILLVAGYALTLMLTLSFSGWWLLLLILLVPLTLIFLILGLVSWFLLQRLLPRKLSASEHTQLTDFTEKLFAVTERAKTPYLVLVFLVAKDVMRGKEVSFFHGIIGSSQSLVKEFAAIQRLFEE